MGFRLTDLQSLLDLEAPGAGAGAGTPSDLAPGQWIEQPLGSNRLYRAALVDPTSGQPIAAGTYSPGDAVSAVVWDGADGPILASPAATWDTSDCLAIDFLVAATDLAPLEAQPYPIRLLVGSGSTLASVWDGWIDVLMRPGSGAAVPVYGSYQDILRYCGSRVAQFLTADQRAGFLTERGEAREWLDAAILAHYRPKFTSYYGVGMAYTYGTGSLFPLGIGSLGYRTPPIGPDPDLKAALDSGGLDVTPRVREIVARYAGSLILGRQTSAEWQNAALAERMRADSLAGSLVAQVSTQGPNSKDFAINLSVFDGRDM